MTAASARTTPIGKNIFFIIVIVDLTFCLRSTRNPEWWRIGKRLRIVCSKSSKSPGGRIIAAEAGVVCVWNTQGFVYKDIRNMSGHVHHDAGINCHSIRRENGCASPADRAVGSEDDLPVAAGRVEFQSCIGAQSSVAD